MDRILGFQLSARNNFLVIDFGELSNKNHYLIISCLLVADPGLFFLADS
jgi:hypothetical protein